MPEPSQPRLRAEDCRLRRRRQRRDLPVCCGRVASSDICEYQEVVQLLTVCQVRERVPMDKTIHRL